MNILFYFGFSPTFNPFNLLLKELVELSFNLKIPSNTISSADVVSNPVNPAKSFTQHPAAIISLPLFIVPAAIGI
jgi:hypothetical protein